VRLITSFVLTQRGGFLLHSCGAVLDGYAYCLAGPSGTGKSTVARLLDSRHTLLSDETIAITKGGKGYCAWATPFFGDFGRITSNHSAPLKALIFLKQAKQFQATRLDPHDAARRLMQNIFLIGDRWTHDMTALLDTVSDMTQKVPAFALEFMPENEIWQYIKEKISPGAS
jgi:hypothetical protein